MIKNIHFDVASYTGRIISLKRISIEVREFLLLPKKPKIKNRKTLLSPGSSIDYFNNTQIKKTP